MSSPGIRTPAAALPSTAAAVMAASGSASAPAAAIAPAGTIPRTGGEISASAVLAIILLLVGGALRKTARN